MTHAYLYSVGSQTLNLVNALEPTVLSATPECGAFSGQTGGIGV